MNESKKKKYLKKNKIFSQNKRKILEKYNFKISFFPYINFNFFIINIVTIK